MQKENFNNRHLNNNNNLKNSDVLCMDTKTRADVRVQGEPNIPPKNEILINKKKNSDGGPRKRTPPSPTIRNKNNKLTQAGVSNSKNK